MSILNKLKNLNTRKAARLLEVHPLAGESLELRLQYLAGVALATAIDREPNDAERMAFNALADSLAVDAVDAQEQLDERASVTEEDIALLFVAIRERDAGYLYLLDLAWVHAVDGELEENEIAVTEELAELLDINITTTQILHDISLSIHQNTLHACMQTIANAWQYEPLRPHLKKIINRYIPFSGATDQRWIDHGNETITDATTGITWKKRSEGRITISKTFLKSTTSELISEKLNELEIIPPWRAPSENELKNISVNGKLPKKIFHEELIIKNIFTSKTQEAIDKLDIYNFGEEYRFEILVCKKEGI